ncbi:P-loop containing nucleoside triphosphate hydrolase protein [Hyaloraphidium curvatum]|nr:P-loop containing nucleoside triphosphate hydrolase protein [Hyaloraphidium curvatum]
MAAPAYVIPDSDEDEPLVVAAVEIAAGPGARRPGNSSRTSRASGPGASSLSQQLLEVEHDLDLVQEKIDVLQAEKKKLTDVKLSIERRIRQAEDDAEEEEQAHFRELNRKTDWKSATAFAWSPMLPDLAKQYFDISSFRSPQLEVVNATLSGRDVFMIAATGHGKSLTFQLPALLHPSITLVVSPLVSLSRDQVLSLEDRGIKAAMLYAGTPKDEEKRILDEMLWGPGGQREYLDTLDEDEPVYDGSLRLVFVTPEKLNKSKRFMNHLEKVYARGRLARICIDEAHCASQLGHDFRPDYKKLGILKQLFPNIPLLALSATCPPSLVASCFTILGLRDVESDARNGCLVFSSELYRKNLHYSVVQKGSSSDEQVGEIAEWMDQHHPDETGIVYCLSKKDAEQMAAGLQERGVAAAFYHADADDRDKVHRQWRNRQLKVVCATIAFGLGIDFPSVRFVIHATLSKSVEGLYQESGRAGRDGLDSDCVLFYRPSDFSRLSAMTAGEPEGKRGVLGMLRYCEDLTTCRRVLMDRYFGREGLRRQGGAEQKCGHCDNCRREPGSIVSLEVTKHALAVCGILEALKTSGKKDEKATLIKLVDLWRGSGLGKHTAAVAAAVPADAKRELSRLQMERIVVQCVISGLIEDVPHFTAYTTVSYLQCSQRGQRLIRLHQGNPSDVQSKVYVEFPAQPEPAKPTARKRKSSGAASDAKAKPKPKKRTSNASGDDAIVIEDSDSEADQEIEEEEEPDWAPRRKKRAAVDSDDEEY